MPSPQENIRKSTDYIYREAFLGSRFIFLIFFWTDPVQFNLPFALLLLARSGT
jgi:hypothetical protein